ncbi:STAS domain-containing protein [Sorangium sp. So ce136]|uniref:STAS domain-containing protein n=1 Tax=Sorangium sp. So ce136 TaxID=3133284 RepID=UPI003EFD97C0
MILDLTGVMDVDTSTAEHLVRLAKAVQSLGARCVVSGIGAEVAQTLATPGISLEALSPTRNLQQALKHCLVAGRRLEQPRESQSSG